MKRPTNAEKKLWHYLDRKLKNYPEVVILDIDVYGEIMEIEMNYKRREIGFVLPYDNKDYQFYYNDKKMKLFEIIRKIKKEA